MSQLPDSAEIQFPLCAPTTDAFRDLGPELLVQAEPLLCQFVRIKGVGQLHQDLAHLRQSLSKLALQAALDGLRVNGLGLDDRTYPFIRRRLPICPGLMLRATKIPNLTGMSGRSSVVVLDATCPEANCFSRAH